MIQEFSIQKIKKIACCIVDNTNTYSSGWAKEISINISDFLVHRFVQYEFDVFIHSDEDQLLKHVSTDSYYSHAVIISSGMSLGLSDRIFLAIEKKCEEDFFIAGHVLERNENSYWKNGYYELHHQFYIIRMSEYREIDFPRVGKFENTSHFQQKPTRSEECLYNDHEVAAWISPGSDFKEYNMKCHGWNIISTALKHDKKIIDLGIKIRDNKKYLYYEYDHVFIKQLPEIYHNQLLCNTFFPSWNSDNYIDSFLSIGSVQQYITVGIGVFWVSNLYKMGYSKDCKLIFTDINYNCLQFMKAMVENWDGINYPDFYQKHMTMLPSGFNRNINEYLEYTKKEWDNFLTVFPNWQNAWNEIKKLNFEYVLIDYTGKYDLNFIDADKNTFINLSDVFTHSPYTPTQSLKYRVAGENRLINKLKNINSNFFLNMTGRSADGFHPNKERIRVGKLEEFDLTDINELNRPQWHQSDWSSVRLLD